MDHTSPIFRFVHKYGYESVTMAVKTAPDSPQTKAMLAELQEALTDIAGYMPRPQTVCNLNH